MSSLGLDAAVSATQERFFAWPLGLGSILHPRSRLRVSVIVFALVGLLCGCWALTYLLGGADKVPPHSFYIPITMAAFRFGHPGAAILALAAGTLAGPLMPADVQAGTLQESPDWIGRSMYFFAMGQFVALFTKRYEVMESRARRHDAVVREYQARLAPHDLAADLERLRAAEIRRTITDGELSIVFQPIVELHGSRVVKVEALARFPREPIRPPDVWFGQAWLAGLGPDLETMAVAKAMEEKRRLPADLDMAVNVSPETIESGLLEELLVDYPCNRLILELTEHAPIEDYDAFDQFRLDLVNRGIRFAIDDVGAGFASLRHILRLRPDFVKLDRSLVSEVDTDGAKLALAMGVLACSRRLGAKVIAEGLETAQEVQAMLRIGVELGQGFLFARPAPAEGVWLQSDYRQYVS